MQTLAGFQDEARALYTKTRVAYPVGAWAVYEVEGNVVYVTDLFHRGKGY